MVSHHPFYVCASRQPYTLSVVANVLVACTFEEEQSMLEASLRADGSNLLNEYNLNTLTAFHEHDRAFGTAHLCRSAHWCRVAHRCLSRGRPRSKEHSSRVIICITCIICLICNWILFASGKSPLSKKETDNIGADKFYTSVICSHAGSIKSHMRALCIVHC